MAIIKAKSGTLTLGASGQTVALAGGVTSNLLTPMFSAKISSNQSIPDSSFTLIQFDTEQFDTDNAYNTSTYKFTVPSDKAGKYLFNVNLRKENWTSTRLLINLEVNNSAEAVFENADGGAYDTVNGVGILDLSVGDEVSIKFYQNNGVSKEIRTESVFQGYRIGA